jgi:hypothetical protein
MVPVNLSNPHLRANSALSRGRYGSSFVQDSRNENASLVRQRGAVLLLAMLVLLVGGSYLFIRTVSTSSSARATEAQGRQMLAEAKNALLAWSVAAVDNTLDAGQVASRPGQLPAPDMYATANGDKPGALVNAIRYDGWSDRYCIHTAWTLAQPLRGIIGGNWANNNSIRCMGKLPWKTLGLSYTGLTRNTVSPPDLLDPAGRVPWYVVSNNLIDWQAGPCPTRLDTATAASVQTANNCGTAATATRPFPWITVLDAYGNTVTTRGAAVLLLAGAPVARQAAPLVQTRTGANTPANYLDTVTNAACGGACDNAAYNTAPVATQPITLIQCVDQDTARNDPRFTQPYTCNDRLVVITIDELIDRAAARIAADFSGCLREFAAANGNRYPWAATAPNPGSVTTGTTNGIFPSNDEAANLICPLRVSSYWGGWQRVTAYRLLAGRTVAEFDLSLSGGTKTYRVGP